MISDRLERNFSPYELARMKVLIGGPMAIACIAAFMTGRAVGGIVLTMLAMAMLIVLTMASRCPTCGKTPFARDGFNWFELYVLKAGQRFWPERRCSRCGTALDVIPDDRR